MNWREIVVDAVWYALGGIARRRWDGRRRKTGPNPDPTAAEGGSQEQTKTPDQDKRKGITKLEREKER